MYRFILGLILKLRKSTFQEKKYLWCPYEAFELFRFKDTINFAALLLAAGNKKFQRANAIVIRVWCKWIHPTIGWRWVEHGTHKHAHGPWILSSLSRTTIYIWLYVTSIRDSFWTFAHGFIRLPPRRLVSSQGYVLYTRWQ